eukprot:435012_1
MGQQASQLFNTAVSRSTMQSSQSSKTDHDISDNEQLQTQIQHSPTYKDEYKNDKAYKKHEYYSHSGVKQKSGNVKANKPLSHGEWKCNICTQTQSRDYSVCILCGHSNSIQIDNEWQCVRCNLIQSKVSLICSCCGRKNQRLCDENLKIIRCDKKELPMFAVNDETHCVVCTEKCKHDAIIWNCDATEFLCNRCYVMKMVQITPMSTKTCNLITCHYFRRFVLCINRYNKNKDDTIYTTECQITCKIRNDSEHLMKQHGSVQEFEYIISKLDKCDIARCTSYIGHNRDKNNINFYEIERIHCHFQHQCGYISGNEAPLIVFDKEGCIVCGRKSEHEQILWRCDEGNICDNCYEIVQRSLHGDKCELMNCFQLKRFAIQMIKYNQCNHNDDYGLYQNISGILDAYLHLIHQHDANEDFELIARRLGSCKLAKCTAYSRNNRNRNLIDIVTTDHVEQKVDTFIEEVVCQHIMDKVHCYFQHCYDIGNRLSMEERSQLKTEIEQEQKNSTTAKMVDFCSENHEILAISQILKHKKASRKIDTNNRMSGRMNKKYSQLFSENKQQFNDDSINDISTYKAGYLFNYGYDKENEFDNRCPNENIKVIDIASKYSSFKEELTFNDRIILSVQQYNEEYRKANLHICSFYCKKHYPNIELQHIISLLVYCNYDHLQYEFSKTYRENNGKNHNNFYHFGKYLKQAVHQFGSNMRDFACCGKANNKFYHGVGQVLAFPSYGIEKNQSGYAGIYIFGVLSTSSVLDVAISFSNHTGLLIEFVDNDVKYISPRNFSVSWLSDYGNEHEYLFVQNLYRFQINSILEVVYGHTYDVILSVLKHEISGYYNRNRNVDKIRSSNLRDKIISNQLANNNIPNYKQYKLSKYGQTICNVFFNNTKEFRMEYMQWNHLGFWRDYKYYKLINLNLICGLFPNIETVVFQMNIFSADILGNILSFFDKQGCQKTKLKVLVDIHVESTNESVIQDSMKKYSLSLKQKNIFAWYILTQTPSARIFVFKLPSIEVALYLMDLGMNNQRAIFADNSATVTCLSTMVEKLIKNKIANVNNNNEQQLFNKYCDEKISIVISCDDEYFNVFGIFIDEKTHFFNIELLNIVFPNVKSIQVPYGISKLGLHYYSKYLMHNKTKLYKISISGDTKNVVIMEYEKQYHGLRYTFPNISKISIIKSGNKMS